MSFNEKLNEIRDNLLIILYIIY